MRFVLVCLVLACAHAAPPAEERVSPDPVAQAPSPAPTAEVTATAPAVEPAVEKPSPGPDVEALLKGMTLEAKVGQMMMVGFGGHVVDAAVVALVQGKQVQTRINDMLVVDYLEPDPPFRGDPKF